MTEREPHSAISLARALARILDHLRDMAERGHRYDDWERRPCPAARALQSVVDDLEDEYGSPELTEMLLWGVITAYEDTQDELGQIEEAARQREQREAEANSQAYEEAVRQHELAVTVDCPYCGATPGRSCVTAGPSGVGHPRGVHDHRSRYRAATSTLRLVPADHLEVRRP